MGPPPAACDPSHRREITPCSQIELYDRSAAAFGRIEVRLKPAPLRDCPEGRIGRNCSPKTLNQWVI